MEAWIGGSWDSPTRGYDRSAREPCLTDQQLQGILTTHHGSRMLSARAASAAEKENACVTPSGRRFVSFSTPSALDKSQNVVSKAHSERKPSFKSTRTQNNTDNTAKQNPHTVSKASAIAHPAPRSATRARRPLQMGSPAGSNAAAADDSDFPTFESFRGDSNSLKEILGGSGISDSRIPKALPARSTSTAAELKEMREKRSSIFHGAIRVASKAPKAATPLSMRMSFASSSARERESIYERAAGRMTTPAKSRNESASNTPRTPSGLPSVDHKTPTQARTPGRGAGGAMSAGQQFARAKMTPSNSRARGVASLIGSFLVDKQSTKVAPPAIDSLEKGEAATTASTTPSAGEDASSFPVAAVHLPLPSADDLQHVEEAASAAVSVAAPCRTPSAFRKRNSREGAQEKVEEAQFKAAAEVKQADGAPLGRGGRGGGGGGRSRKSLLLRESRRRCGIQTPEAKRRPAREEEEEEEEDVRDSNVVDDDKDGEVEADEWVAMSPDVQEIVGGAEEGEIEILEDDEDDVFAEDGEVVIALRRKGSRSRTRDTRMTLIPSLEDFETGLLHSPLPCVDDEQEDHKATVEMENLLSNPEVTITGMTPVREGASNPVRGIPSVHAISLLTKTQPTMLDGHSPPGMVEGQMHITGFIVGLEGGILRPKPVAK